ncbi:unnamed protein product, partial [Polarella glacialis]
MFVVDCPCAFLFCLFVVVVVCFFISFVLSAFLCFLTLPLSMTPAPRFPSGMAEWLGGQTVSSFSFDKTEYEERSSDSVAPRDTPGSPDASTVIIKHLPRGCHRREIFQALKDLGFDKHTLSSSRLNFCSGACLCNFKTQELAT